VRQALGSAERRGLARHVGQHGERDDDADDVHGGGHECDADRQVPPLRRAAQVPGQGVEAPGEGQRHHEPEQPAGLPPHRVIGDPGRALGGTAVFPL
jgi:hypothetical protein